MKYLVAVFFAIYAMVAHAEVNVYLNIHAPNVYADCSVKGDHCSVEDPVNKKLAEKLKRDYWNQIQMIERNSDKFYFEENVEAGDAVKEWFMAYVSQKGLLKPLEEPFSSEDVIQNWTEIRWALAPICLAYYKTKALYTADEKKAIEKWITKVVDTSIYSKYFYDWRDDKFLLNNYYYTTGLALFAAGFVTNNRSMIRDAKRTVDVAFKNINDEGIFADENRRATMTAHYSSLATTMVVVALHYASLSDEAYANKMIKDPRLIKAEYASVKLFTDDEFHKKVSGGYEANRHHNKSRCTTWAFPYLQLSTDEQLKSLMTPELKWLYEDCDWNYIIGGNPNLLREKIFKIK